MYKFHSLCFVFFANVETLGLLYFYVLHILIFLYFTSFYICLIIQVFEYLISNKLASIKTQHCAAAAAQCCAAQHCALRAASAGLTRGCAGLTGAPNEQNER